MAFDEDTTVGILTATALGHAALIRALVQNDGPLIATSVVDELTRTIRASNSATASALEYMRRIVAREFDVPIREDV